VIYGWLKETSDVIDVCADSSCSPILYFVIDEEPRFIFSFARDLWFILTLLRCFLKGKTERKNATFPREFPIVLFHNSQSNRVSSSRKIEQNQISCCIQNWEKSKELENWRILISDNSKWWLQLLWPVMNRRR